MKHILHFLIIGIMVFRPIIPVIVYVVNYDYIVKNLCENRKKPSLHCNGKCYLAKELAKASEQKNAQEKHKWTFLPLDFFLDTTTYSHWIDQTFHALNKHPYFYYSSFYFSSFHTKIFRPPAYQIG